MTSSKRQIMEVIEVDHVEEGLNVGIVPISKMYNIGTVPTYKTHNVGTVPTYKTHNLGTELSYAALGTTIKLIAVKFNLIKLSPGDFRRQPSQSILTLVLVNFVVFSQTVFVLYVQSCVLGTHLMQPCCDFLLNT